MSRALTLVLAIGLASACGSDEPFTPTEPGGPVIPSIGGTYSSPTMWQFTLTRDADGSQRLVTCAGNFTVGTQVADAFSGSFQLSDPACGGGSISGAVTSGTLATNGTVTFALRVAGTDPNFLTAAFACTYVSGDTGMSGTIVGTQVQAQSTTAMDCPVNGGRSTLLIRMSGER